MASIKISEKYIEQVWFTSDMHYDHANIIRYCNRPFSSIVEMNSSLINNYNNLVGEKDTCYLLGDIIFKGSDRMREILPKLHGHKHLIIGNHDSRKALSPYFASTESYSEISIKETGQRIILCHYPLARWNTQRYGSIHLHGHTHGNFLSPGLLRFDVGVDPNNYRPISLKEVLERASKVVREGPETLFGDQSDRVGEVE